REELDSFSLKSHQLALQAIEAGRYQNEIVPIEVEDDKGKKHMKTYAFYRYQNEIVPIEVEDDKGKKHMFSIDEGQRKETSMEALTQLQPVFKEDGVITVGNASQMSDGASAVLLMSREKADALGLKPKARILARTVVGSDPTYMLTGPIPATEKVLEKAHLTLSDIDLYEVNEAFASVPLAWQQELQADPNKLN